MANSEFINWIDADGLSASEPYHCPAGQVVISPGSDGVPYFTVSQGEHIALFGLSSADPRAFNVTQIGVGYGAFLALPSFELVLGLSDFGSGITKDARAGDAFISGDQKGFVVKSGYGLAFVDIYGQYVTGIDWPSTLFFEKWAVIFENSNNTRIVVAGRNL
jgi:hypothetical protein